MFARGAKQGTPHRYVLSDNAYKRVLIGILLVILAFNFVDRVFLGLVLLDIKADLSLSDTQLGMLSGMAFAFFYCLFGIPLARWADHGNRVAIISVTAALWSGAVALCAAASSFVQLVCIRIFVAVGEAGCMPPAYSLIADSFSRSERPRAVARYMLGSPLSYILGYFLGGWLNSRYGWRVAFMMLGLPGLVLAILAALLLREPRRMQVTSAEVAAESCDAEDVLATNERKMSLAGVLLALWKNVTFRQLLFCFSVLCYFATGVGTWQPAFFIRTYGVSTAELGTWLALIWGVGGMLGMYWGGVLATRYAARNESLQLKAMAIAFLGFSLLSTMIYFSPNRYVALGFLGIGVVGSATVYAPMFATIQTLVPQRMRAMAIAILYLFANLIGMGLGPLTVGALSDALRPWAGDESLRYALLALCPGYWWVALHFWRASRTVSRDMDAAQRHDASDDREMARLENVPASCGHA